MKRILLMMVVVGAWASLIGVSNVHAFGFGAYLETAKGSGTYEDLYDDGYGYSGPDGYSDSIDVDAVGFGFVMDTNLSGQNVFNYRMSVGYANLDVPDSVGPDVDGDRISMDHTFGFGIVRNENMRFWIGPQIHLDYSKWDIPLGSELLSKDSVDFLGFGFGAASGMNFHIPNAGSICPEFGVRYQLNFSDRYEETYYDGYYVYFNEVDYSYTETVVFFKISYMFGE